jgi:hypothetical protein
MSAVYQISDYQPLSLAIESSRIENHDLALSRRGVSWVLRWAAAAVVLCVSAIVLLDFAYRLAAELSLARAAAAGLRASALARPNGLAIQQSIRRELGNSLYRDAVVRLQSGSPVIISNGQPKPGDFSVTIALPNSSALPAWLRTLSPWEGSTEIVAQARRVTNSIAWIANQPLAAANISAYSTTQPSINSWKRVMSNSSSR